MAYSTDNPPQLRDQLIAGERKAWHYESTDASTVVRVDGYITNAQDLGMTVGDQVISVDTDNTFLTTSHTVAVINADGSADLTDGVPLTSVTNTD